jgi:SAM-dependent methyltransferase
LNRRAGAIHASAAVGFDRAGADYERGRPGYPDEAVALLARALDIGPGRRVVDLGAGTGKLTRSLLPYGAALLAVEPVGGMREQLVRTTTGVEVIAGTAERIGIPDASADVVLVAQAFHWFQADTAAVEIHRVLVPGGGLGVIWNAWDESVAWVARVQRRVHQHVGQTPKQRTSRWREALAASRRFTELTERRIAHVLRGDRDALLARIASVSYIAALADRDRRRVLEDVGEIVAEDPQTRESDQLDMPYVTHVTWCRRR